MEKIKTSRKSVLLIERLDVSTLPVWIWLAWWHRGGYFIGWSRMLRASWVRRSLCKLAGLRQLKYEDFPGTYWEALRIAAESANDALYEQARNREAGPIIAFIMRFRDHELMEVALRRTLQDVYTLSRVKTLVMLRELVRTHEKVVFWPRDKRDLHLGIPRFLRQALAVAEIPAISRIANTFKSWLEPLAAVGCVILMVGNLVLQRGIVLRVPTPRRWRVAYDSFDEGIAWDKPYHHFFLYDDRELTPKTILHVVRNRLCDDRTRRYFEENGMPFVEAAKVPIPLSYLSGRIIRQFCGGIVLLILKQYIKAAQEDSQVFVWAAMRVQMNLIKGELLELSHRPDVFVGRDEYSASHILRTLLYDERGGMTIGCIHGDNTNKEIYKTYLSCHVFCFWGEFSRTLLRQNVKYSRSTYVIGAGLFGLDETHRRIQSGELPDRYIKLRGRYQIVGVFDTSFQEDFFSTRELMHRFYEAVLSIPKRHPDVLLVLRPKAPKLRDPEFRRLFKEAGPRVILEEDISTYELIPVLDLAICAIATSVGLQALMAGKRVIYFDESEFRDHPYERHDPFLVARSPEELLDRVERILVKDEYVDPETLAYIRSYHGFRFDGKVTKRFRDVIYQALETTAGRNEAPVDIGEHTGSPV